MKNGYIKFNEDKVNINIERMNIDNYQNQLIFDYEPSDNDIEITINEITNDNSINIIDNRYRNIKLKTSTSKILLCDKQSYIYNYQSIETCK